MLLIDYSLETPQANLAFDEAMIESVDPTLFWQDLSNDLSNSQCDSAPNDPLDMEALRLWEMPSKCVVMGRGSKALEVNEIACKEAAIPLLRRCSGGASIVAGPGCLMYSLLLSLEHRPFLRGIDVAHQWVMERIGKAVKTVVPEISLQGTCDLTLNDRKFSGNAVRYKRDWLLYHGTLLYDFDVSSVARYLNMPPRQPAYRESRAHDDFLVNLECNSTALRQALSLAWQADQHWRSHRHSTKLMNTYSRILEMKYV